MKNSTAMINVVCAILFIAFTFCYVYFLQADLLAYAQYVWSGGIRHLGPFVWASLITGTLFIVQQGVRVTLVLPRRVQALSFFPSFLMLGILTSMNKNEEGIMTVGHWWWIMVVLFVLYYFLIRMLAGYVSMENTARRSHILSKTAWNNLLIMLIMMLMVCAIGNTDAMLHHRLKMERCITENRYEDALRESHGIGEKDSTISMLTIMALSAEGKLGEDVFDYSLTGGSKSMLPQPDGSVGFTMTDSEPIWRHVGAAPRKWDGNVRAFLQQLILQKKVTEYTEDYLLTALLLDRDIEAFAKEIQRFYDFRTQEEITTFEEKIEKQRAKLAKTIGEKEAIDSIPGIILTPVGKKIKQLSELPKNYRQAILIYNRLHPSRALQFDDAPLETDFEDFHNLLRGKNQEKKVNEYELRDTYQGTYWYYYYR